MQIKHPERLNPNGNSKPANSAPVVCYCDGGCQGNGTANTHAYGSYKIANRPIVWTTYADGHGITTNNEAEYQTLIDLLRDLDRTATKHAEILMDSNLVVEQVAGRWKVKELRLRPYCQQAKDLLQKTGATLSWVNRGRIVSVLGH